MKAAETPSVVASYLIQPCYSFLFRNKDLDPKQVRYGVVYQVDMLADIVNLGEAAYQSVMKLNFSSDLQVIGVEVNKVRIFWISTTNQYLDWKMRGTIPLFQTLR